MSWLNYFIFSQKTFWFTSKIKPNSVECRTRSVISVGFGKTQSSQLPSFRPLMIGIISIVHVQVEREPSAVVDTLHRSYGTFRTLIIMVFIHLKVDVEFNKQFQKQWKRWTARKQTTNNRVTMNWKWMNPMQADLIIYRNVHGETAPLFKTQTIQTISSYSACVLWLVVAFLTN